MLHIQTDLWHAYTGVAVATGAQAAATVLFDSRGALYRTWQLWQLTLPHTIAAAASNWHVLGLKCLQIDPQTAQWTVYCLLGAV